MKEIIGVSRVSFKDGMIDCSSVAIDGNTVVLVLDSSRSTLTLDIKQIHQIVTPFDDGTETRIFNDGKLFEQFRTTVW